MGASAPISGELILTAIPHQPPTGDAPRIPNPTYRPTGCPGHAPSPNFSSPGSQGVLVEDQSPVIGRQHRQRRIPSTLRLVPTCLPPKRSRPA